MTDRPDGPAWSWKKTYWILYPFTTGAVAINLFMFGLLGPFVGLPNIEPIPALIWSVPLGLPANWLVTKWMRDFVDEAEGRKRPD